MNWDDGGERKGTNNSNCGKLILLLYTILCIVCWCCQSPFYIFYLPFTTKMHFVYFICPAFMLTVTSWLHVTITTGFWFRIVRFCATTVSVSSVYISTTANFFRRIENFWSTTFSRRWMHSSMTTSFNCRVESNCITTSNVSRRIQLAIAARFIWWCVCLIATTVCTTWRIKFSVTACFEWWSVCFLATTESSAWRIDNIITTLFVWWIITFEPTTLLEWFWC